MRTVVTCMKNEGPFILEWIAYHLSIGFDHFLVYTNDCEDETDSILTRLEQLGLCTHLPNPRIGNQRPQAVAMRDMFNQAAVKRAEWVLFSDCDEFLNIHLGDGSLDCLLEAAGDVEVFSPMWRLFGDSGIINFEDTPVIKQFLRAAPKDRPVSTNSWGFKSMFKPSSNIERIGAHRPFFRDESAVDRKWLNSNGQPISGEYLKGGWRYTRTTGAGYGWAQLNHYAVRSVDSFLVKCDRGHVLHTHKDIDLTYHMGMNFNQEIDESILRRADGFDLTINELRDDVELSQLHRKSVRIHRDRAATLRTERSALFRALVQQANSYITSR